MVTMLWCMPTPKAKRRMLLAPVVGWIFLAPNAVVKGYSVSHTLYFYSCALLLFVIMLAPIAKMVAADILEQEQNAKVNRKNQAVSYADELDPADSVLSFYATDLRRFREKAGITQRDLAKRAHMAPSLLNKIEATKRLPSRELSVLCDDVFGTGDHFQRLWPLVIKYAYPSWFRPFVELEEAATVIRSFQVQVVPGLLQTEEYARVLLSTLHPDPGKLDELVAGRMERQRILTRDKPPELWVILDENVLRRRMGSPTIMRAQLESLVAAALTPKTILQVVPYDAGAHAGVDGSFAALTLDEGPDVVYVDGFLRGQILAEPEDVKAADRAPDLLRAVALSPDRSIDLIT